MASSRGSASPFAEHFTLNNPVGAAEETPLLPPEKHSVAADTADADNTDVVDNGTWRTLAGDKHMAPARRKSRNRPVHSRSKSSSRYSPQREDRHSELLTPGRVEADEMRPEDESLLADDEEVGLTEPERKKRTLRKNQNARLDEQVSRPPPSIRSGISVASEGSIGTTEEKLIMPTLVKNMVLNAVLIGLWYTFSISISVYNKWMFSGDNLDFQFPLFTTSLHMVVQFSLASTVLYFMPQFRPSNSTTNPHEPSYSRLSSNEEDETVADPSKKSHQPLMTQWFYLTRIGPCGAATALDIGLGNFSLRFISLTFFTMCKSSVLGFVLLFAFIFHLEQPTWKLCFIILLMTIGVIMMVAGETAFSVLGFILIMLASLCSGFRWSLTQILLLRNRATSNPFSTIAFLTPVMFLSLLILAIPIEGPENVVAGVRKLASSEGGFQSFCLLLFPGILAFLMVSAEFALLKRTSVVTLSVCGIFKEVLTISTAGAVFGDELSPINISGLFVTIASIAAYNYIKYNKMRKEAAQEAHEIVAAEAAAASGERSKTPVVVAPATSGARADESNPLTGDSLHLPRDMNANDRGHESQSNGTVSAPGKRPEHLD